MTAWQIEYDRGAARDPRGKTDRRLLLRLKSVIEALRQDPRPDCCRKLTGLDDLWRVRVGDWRVVHRIEEDRLVILVIAVSPRGRVCRDL